MIGSVLAIVGAAAIGVGGCGADSSDSAKQTSPASEPAIDLPLVENSLSKRKYIPFANGICRGSLADMRKQFAYYRKKWNVSAASHRLFAYMSQSVFLPHMQFWFDDISYLGTPKGERVPLEDLLKALQLGVFSGQERRIDSVRLLAAVMSSFNRLAREYGLDDCIVDSAAFKLR